VSTYNACWPITDDTATLRDLIAEATPDLERMVADTGYDITGEVSWTTTDAGGLSLLASAPVEPEPAPTPRHIAVAENVEWVLDSDPAITATDLAARLGINPKTLYGHLDTAGRDDLRNRLRANGAEAGIRQTAQACSDRRVA
jgi:hypothetical protein